MEFMPNFQLHRPSNVDDAVELGATKNAARYVAGGTDMLVNVRRGIEQPENLIELTNVAELKQIAQDDDGVHIGAAVTLKEIAENDYIRANYQAVAEAAAAVAGPTHQAYGTLGGNLCLDTRCLYYNQSEWWRQANAYCLKERGEICHVAPGGKRCFAAFSGDVAPSLLVYRAEVDIAGPQGNRRVALSDLYRNDGLDHLTLEPGEIVTNVHLPKSLAGCPSRYEKARVRGSIDFPLAGAAVRLQTDDSGKIEDIAIALTGVNPIPLIVTGSDQLIGVKPGEDDLDKLRDNVRKQAKPMTTTTVAPWYRRRVVGALARRLTAELCAS